MLKYQRVSAKRAGHLHKDLHLGWQDADDEMLLQAASTSDDGPAAKVLVLL